MQLSHMSDRPLDLKTQIQDLTRNTSGAAIATLRCLAIQLGASLATRSTPLIDTDVIDNYRINGMPEHAEMEFLRFGADHLMELVKDAQPSN